MKATLFALFTALLMVGFSGADSRSNSSESNQTSAEIPPANGGIDVDDKETRDKIIAEAVDNDDIPSDYTGWAKDGMWSNGQIQRLIQFKDGKLDGHLIELYADGTQSHRYPYKDGKSYGLFTEWHENGQKKQEGNWRDGKQDGLWTIWHENGQKFREDTKKEGERVSSILYYSNGQKQAECTLKNLKLMAVVSWKPNGEKCPVTNVVNGNGVWVWYKEDGTEKARATFKDGKPVLD